MSQPGPPPGDLALPASANLVVVDTDVWSHIYLPDSRRLTVARADFRRALIDTLAGRTIVIALQTRAELLTYPIARDMGDQRKRVLIERIDSTPTVPVTEDVIAAWAELTVACKKAGHPLGEKAHVSDRWVAATAIAIRAPLLAVDRIYPGTPGLSQLPLP